MRSHGSLRGLAFVLLAYSCSAAADTDQGSSPKSETIPLKQRFQWSAKYQGKVIRINPSQMTLAIQVQYQTRSLDKGAVQRLNQLQQQAGAQRAALLRAMQFFNPRNAGSVQNVQNVQRRLADLANQIHQTQRSLYKVEMKTKDVDMEAAEDVAVRVPKPPYRFDDKGRLLKYSPEELKEVKGDPDLWGYPGDFEQMAVGQRVQVLLGKTKPTSPAKEDEDDGEYPLVRLIYILDDEQ